MGIYSGLKTLLGGIAGGLGLWLLVQSPATAHPLALHRLETLISEATPTPTLIATGLVLAFGLGALHALSPGHGKTMVAAYLVGSRGTAQQAIALGLITTLTHTAGVFGLGIIALAASQYILPEQLYPVLSFASGLTVLLVGINLVVERWKVAHHSHDHLDHHHHHDHHHHDHHHHHHHSHPHHHSHAHIHSEPSHPLEEQAHEHSVVHTEHSHPQNEMGLDHSGSGQHQRSTWRSLVALGIAGGLVPCPSALVLLLSAIAFHQIAFGLLLVSSFSLGLATILTVLGLVVVYAKQWLNRLPATGKVLQYLPLASAFVVLFAGLSLTLYSLYAI